MPNLIWIAVKIAEIVGYIKPNCAKECIVLPFSGASTSIKSLSISEFTRTHSVV